MNKLTFEQKRKQALTVLQQGINPFKQILPDKIIESTASNTLPAHRRRRDLPAPVVFWLMVFSGMYVSFAQTLQQLWISIRMHAYSPQQQAGITDSAFTHARKRFPLAFLNTLFRHLVDAFRKRFLDRAMLYKGYLLLSLDGSKINLPTSEQLFNTFGGPVNQNSPSPILPQALMVGVVNLLTGVCLDYVIRPYASNESPLLRFLLNRLPGWARAKNPFFLLDKGYYSHMNMLWLKKRGYQFLIRARKNFTYRVIKKYGPGDWLVRVRTSGKTRKKFPDSPRYFTVRLLRYQVKGFRPSMLVTSLSFEEMSSRELVLLYHFRWKVETFYHEIKNTLSVGHIKSRLPRQVYKEIRSQLILNNMIRYVMTEAVEQADQPTVMFSFIRSLRLLKQSVFLTIGWLLGTTAQKNRRWQRLDQIYQSVLEELRSFEVLVRPGRRYPRAPEESIPDPPQQHLKPIDEHLIWIESETDTVYSLFEKC